MNNIDKQIDIVSARLYLDIMELWHSKWDEHLEDFCVRYGIKVKYGYYRGSRYQYYDVKMIEGELPKYGWVTDELVRIMENL